MGYLAVHTHEDALRGCIQQVEDNENVFWREDWFLAVD